VLTLRDVQVLAWFDEGDDYCPECAAKKWDLVRLAKCEQGLADTPEPIGRWNLEEEAVERGWERAEARVAQAQRDHPEIFKLADGWTISRLTQRIAFRIGRDEWTCVECDKALLDVPEIAA
jgi:hypothetical protein